MDIGFIGLGNMGTPIARNLLKAGHTLSVWNRTAAKATPLAQEGAHIAGTPAEAARAEIVFSIVSDDAALRAVAEGHDGVLAGLPKGGMHISLSTIGVATADRLAAAHQAHGSIWISAPVFGRPAAAEAAKLFVVAAGDPAVLDRCETLFAAIGQRTFRVSETPSAANLVKLCGNFMIMAAIEAMAEAGTLAAKTGIPRETLMHVMTETLFGAAVYRTYGDILARNAFRPAGFAAPNGLKDARLVLAEAEAAGVPMPFANVLRDHLLELIAVEGEDIDWSGIGGIVARHAAL